MIKRNQKLPFAAFVFLLLLIIGGLPRCAFLFGDKKADTAEDLAEKGMEYFDDEDYHDALKAFTTLKERYPYSRYAILAELKVADAHFYREEYPEAIAAYADFIQLHPTNDAIPYVLYQIGECYYKQLLSEDRDQTPTRQAISAFQRLLKEHPSSTYANTAKERIENCRKLLARHELYVANFYFKSKYYEAALGRFEGLLAGYKDVLPLHKRREVLNFVLSCKEKLAEEIGEDFDGD
ncbi:MAG: outer membrane protein assembly factor BamD [Deltaproteobacteria bacterium]|jgi:outer membrane protein assembly factor BamD|nr:outer membrane protein assembly factor BamD [Deltaproteobacteria bacterium]